MLEKLKQLTSGGITLLSLFLLSILIGMMLSTTVKRPARARAANPAIANAEPGIRMSGVNAEITEDASRVQHFKARGGRLNAESKILYMDDLEIEFFDNNTSSGTITSPDGRIWLADNAKDRTHTNDLLLRSKRSVPVRYRDPNPQLGTLHTSQLRYFYGERHMQTGPFQRWFMFGQSYMTSIGTRLDVQLTTGSTQFSKLSEDGKPGWLKIDKKDCKL